MAIHPVFFLVIIRTQSQIALEIFKRIFHPCQHDIQPPYFFIIQICSIGFQQIASIGLTQCISFFALRRNFQRRRCDAPFNLFLHLQWIAGAGITFPGLFPIKPLSAQIPRAKYRAAFSPAGCANLPAATFFFANCD